MARWFGTFGFGSILREKFVTFEANGYEEASNIMRQHYGSLWSCIYTEGAFSDQPTKYHLEEVPLGTPNARLDEPLCEQDTPEVFGSREFLEIEDTLDVPEPPPQPTTCRNHFAVARLGRDKVIIHQIPISALSYHEAMVLAAWLIAEAREIKKDSDLTLEEYLLGVAVLLKEGKA